MSQPTTVTFSASPQNEYCVIDNGAAGSSVALSSGSSVWSGFQYDNSPRNFDTCANGAASQNKNAYGVGPVPDWFAGMTTETMSPVTLNILFKKSA